MSLDPSSAYLPWIEYEGESTNDTEILPFSSYPTIHYYLDAVIGKIKADEHKELKPPDIAQLFAKPEQCLSTVWVYENLLFLIPVVYRLLETLKETCTQKECPIMCTKTHQNVQCQVHVTPSKCCAMDYSLHTLEDALVALWDINCVPSEIEKNPRVFSLQKINATIPTYLRRIERIVGHAEHKHEAQFRQFEETHHIRAHFDAIVRLVPALVGSVYSVDSRSSQVSSDSLNR